MSCGHEQSSGTETVKPRNFSLVAAEQACANQPRIRALLRYFDDRTGRRRLPHRADIVPSEMKDILPEIAILSLAYDDKGMLSDVTIQLMGTKLSEVYGEITGKSIFEFAEQDVADRIFTTCLSCLERRAPVLSRADPLSADRPHLTTQCLMVPLSDDGDHIDRIFAYATPKRKSLTAS